MHHFLANVLNIIFTLSMNFQKEYVDVTYIGGLDIIDIGEIEKKFLYHVIIDLNGLRRIAMQKWKYGIESNERLVT